MDLALLAQIFEVCIVPILTVATGYLVSFINKKKLELQNKIDNEMADKYLERLGNIITDCIQATNQTYVETLKEQGKFDEEAQKIAFTKTFNSVINLLGAKGYEVLQESVGDLTEFITQKIEAQIKATK